jgi:hypothetical protein
MAKIFYVHWNEAELKERIKPLQAAGNEVLSHWNTETGAKVKEPYPDAFVISLDRLPSHGKAIAGWVVESKKRQHIPLIFEGGQAEKVETTKQKFPQALYCKTGAVADVLQKLQSGKLKYTGGAATTSKPAASKTSSSNDTFEQLVTKYSPEVQAIARRLREIIYEVAPKADEKVWATGWNVARYADGEELVAIGPLKNSCNLFFAQGAHLPNPDGLLEGTGKGIRHIKVRSLDTIPVGAIKKLIREAKKYAKAKPERRWSS